jgi:hypothetical protein
MVDVDAEALLARELEREHVDTRDRRLDGLRDLPVELLLSVVLTRRHHKKWAPRAHLETSEMWWLEGSKVRHFRGFALGL